MHAAPIIILSYNRPVELAAVLMSLRLQERPVDPARVYLFQDRNTADPTLSIRCVETFAHFFPTSMSFFADVNLGVALNYERAELFAFEILRADCAYFFEDDLLLGRYYLGVLDQLATYALTDDRIAYASAYGNHHLSLEQQKAASGTLAMLSWKWGYVQTRRNWTRQRGFMKGYLDIVRPAAYGSRDEEAINAYFAGYGYGSAGTSQDAAKDVASCVLASCKINTQACHARYIGRAGVHATHSFYSEEGFERTPMFPRPEIVSAPSSAFLDELIHNARAEGKSQHQRNHPLSDADMNDKSNTSAQQQVGSRPIELRTLDDQILTVNVKSHPRLIIQASARPGCDEVRMRATKGFLTELFRHHSSGKFDLSFKFQFDDRPRDIRSVGWQRKLDYASVVIVPDLYHVDNRGYHAFAPSEVPAWASRETQFLWRGATTGFSFTAKTFSDLPRYRMCDLARSFGKFADTAFYKVVQAVSEEDRNEVSNRLVKEQLLRPFMPMEAFAESKFLVIIDGNANSWGMMERFRLGSCALMVDSPWQLWHHRFLRPWQHYVPVRADLSDLLQRMQWCLDHDDEAREIAVAGRSLALSLDYETEMREAAASVIAAFGRVDA